MKLLAAALAHLFMAAVLVGGILLLSSGKPALLLAGLLAYAVAFGKTVASAH